MRLIDLHEDIAYSSQRVDVVNSSEQSSVELLRSLGDVTVFSVLFPHVNTMNEVSDFLTKQYGTFSTATFPSRDVLIEQIKFYLYLERKHDVRIVRKYSDILSGGITLLLAIEGTDSLTDPMDLYFLKELNVRSIGLTWNYDTKFAASCMSKRDFGLTGNGESVVEICNELGLVVDLAHASRKTVLDTCKISRKPVIVSHANTSKVHNHVRNLDDEELEAVCKTGGTIGLTAINPTLSDSPSIDDIAKNAEYIGSNFGWEHVSIGTDFLGISSTPKGFENVSKVRELSELLGSHADDVLWKNALNVLEKIMT
ncbi:MAG: membrane dipeptidase [Candidatus Thermoplasmatota archaeon]|jgi:membrane dipeptidase|nr:membrane dipeptidase [Candidatus Thermoplasmatota archaeon]